MQNPAWTTNWNDRVFKLVRSQGYSTIGEFLSANPRLTYRELLTLLGSDLAEIQLIAARYKEAARLGQTREAAIDAFCRTIYEFFPNGWKEGDNSDSQATLALSGWASELVVTGEQSTLEHIIIALVKAFEPPIGWLPTGVSDSVLVDYFNKYWPA